MRTVPLPILAMLLCAFSTGFASNGGSPAAPAWYHNLGATPEPVVEVGAERFTARAYLVEEAEHDSLWERQQELEPQFADFRVRAGRTIPLVALTRHDRRTR